MAKFVQARNYTPTSGRQIDLIVLHDMEAPETATRAEAVASWFAGPNAPRSSAHWCHDADSSVQCVRDKDVAWHAPGANHNGLGHEMAGYAKQTRAQWLDAYSGRMLRDRVAPQVKADAVRYGIPLRFVGPAELRRGARGITIHRYVSEAFGRSSHWDTGFEFPEDVFLQMCGAAGAPPAGPGPVAHGSTLSRGDSGDEVRDWQRILVGAGKLPASGVDGSFGPATEAATKAFQSQLGVEADGIVGPATHTATAKLLAWLNATTRTVPSTPTYPGVVREGDRGSAVRVWQGQLKKRGGTLGVDGVFGAATKLVMIDWQRRHGLTPDGVGGPATWHSLLFA